MLHAWWLIDPALVPMQVADYCPKYQRHSLLADLSSIAETVSVLVTVTITVAVIGSAKLSNPQGSQRLMGEQERNHQPPTKSQAQSPEHPSYVLCQSCVCAVATYLGLSHSKRQAAEYCEDQLMHCCTEEGHARQLAQEGLVQWVLHRVMHTVQRVLHPVDVS